MLAPSLAIPPSHNEIAFFLDHGIETELSIEGAKQLATMGLKAGIRALDLRDREKLLKIIAKMREIPFPVEISKDVEQILEVFSIGEKYLQSRFSEALSHISMLLDEENFPPFLQVEILIIASNCHFALENVEKAFELATTAVKTADATGNEWRRIQAMTRLANATFSKRNYRLAESMYRHLRTIIPFEDDFYTFLFSNNLAASLFHQGKIQEAIKELEIALFHADSGNVGDIMRGIIHQNIGEANLILNRTEEAKNHLLKSKKLLEQDSSIQVIYLAETLLMLVEALTLRNEVEEVSKVLDEFRKLLARFPKDNIPLRTKYLTAKAIFELSRANFSFAAQLIKKALELEEEKIRDSNLLLWRLHAFISLILYQFSKHPKHLEVAKNRIEKLKEVGAKSSYAHLLAQIHYLSALVGYYSRDKQMFTNGLDNARAYAEMLPRALRKRYLILLNSLDFSSDEPIVLSLEDIFQIALPLEWGNHEVERKSQETIDHVALFSIEDFMGPEILFDEGKIQDREFLYRQGAFLVALIGVGDLYAEGFWGPMPTPDPEYVVYVRTKKLRNSRSSDPRKDKWTYLLLTFFAREGVSSSAKIALSLKKLSEHFFSSIEEHEEIQRSRWERWIKSLEENLEMEGGK